MMYRSRSQSRQTAAVAAVVAVAAMASSAHAHASDRGHGHHGSGKPGAAAEQAIDYARHQVGCAYVYGAVGPCSSGFDCSGLVQTAYAHAGVSIPRTSEDQWASLRHVPAGQRKAGDLVFAPGSPIDPPPGHVGLLIGKNTVEQAYGTGYPVNIVSLSAFGAGSGGITGFARP